ncbi:MAG: antitoxin VapB family protein [Nanoarchaeota archaeon]
MVNINISLTEEAYRFLKTLKGKDKSFSDVVIEMKENECNRKGSKEAIMKFFGCLKDKNIDWDEKEKGMKKFREGFNKNLRERRNDRARH